MHQSNNSGMCNTASTLGLPDSWSLHSHLMMPRPSWLSAEEEEAIYMRISIGEFMGARTEMLGSLDGDEKPTSQQRVSVLA